MLNGRRAKESINTLIDLIWLRVQHHDIVSDVVVSGAKAGQLVGVLILTDLRVSGQELLERIDGLIHALLQELTLVEEGRI